MQHNTCLASHIGSTKLSSTKSVVIYGKVHGYKDGDVQSNWTECGIGEFYWVAAIFMPINLGFNDSTLGVGWFW